MGKERQLPPAIEERNKKKGESPPPKLYLSEEDMKLLARMETQLETARQGLAILEEKKFTILKDIDQMKSEQKNFHTSIYAKFELDPNFEIDIDPETREINITTRPSTDLLNNM